MASDCAKENPIWKGATSSSITQGEGGVLKCERHWRGLRYLRGPRQLWVLLKGMTSSCSERKKEMSKIVNG